jgi:hypothetical protein
MGHPVVVVELTTNHWAVIKQGLSELAAAIEEVTSGSYVTVTVTRVPVQNGRRSMRVPDASCHLQAPSAAFHRAGAARHRTSRRRRPNCPLRMRCISSMPAIVIAA